MRLDVSAEAGEYVRAQGGQLWVWAAHPRVCCWGSPAYLHTATAPPTGLSGFSPVRSGDLGIWFRATAGRHPDFLEIGMRGRRHPRVEAYWDGCAFVLLASQNLRAISIGANQHLRYREVIAGLLRDAPSLNPAGLGLRVLD
jgi:hypothetical protein